MPFSEPLDYHPLTYLTVWLTPQYYTYNRRLNVFDAPLMIIYG